MRRTGHVALLFVGRAFFGGEPDGLEGWGQLEGVGWRDGGSWKERGCGGRGAAATATCRLAQDDPGRLCVRTCAPHSTLGVGVSTLTCRGGGGSGRWEQQAGLNTCGHANTVGYSPLVPRFNRTPSNGRWTACSAPARVAQAPGQCQCQRQGMLDVRYVFGRALFDMLDVIGPDTSPHAPAPAPHPTLTGCPPRSRTDSCSVSYGLRPQAVARSPEAAVAAVAAVAGAPAFTVAAAAAAAGLSGRPPRVVSTWSAAGTPSRACGNGAVSTSGEASAPVLMIAASATPKRGQMRRPRGNHACSRPTSETVSRSSRSQPPQ